MARRLMLVKGKLDDAAELYHAVMSKNIKSIPACRGLGCLCQTVQADAGPPATQLTKPWLGSTQRPWLTAAKPW